MTRQRMRNAALVAAAMAVMAAGCGDDDSDEMGGAAPTAVESEHGTDHDQVPDGEVLMRLVAFRPDTLTVPIGTTVTWRQGDAGFHTVTSGTVRQDPAGVTPTSDGRFDSGRVAEGDTFEHQFTEVGTYPYFCAVHPATMRGEIAVT